VRIALFAGAYPARPARGKQGAHPFAHRLVPGRQIAGGKLRSFG